MTTRFSQQEIDLARQMRDHGLAWEPAVGHYVFDEANIIEVQSPFQEGVYFILDMKHFLRRSETVEGLKSSMFWLPQWHQARQILREMGLATELVVKRLTAGDDFATDSELTVLYQLIIEQLT